MNKPRTKKRKKSSYVTFVVNLNEETYTRLIRMARDLNITPEEVMQKIVKAELCSTS